MVYDDSQTTSGLWPLPQAACHVRALEEAYLHS